MSMADRRRKFCWAAAPPDGCACRDSRVDPYRVGSASIAQAARSAYPSAGEPSSDRLRNACCSRGSAPRDRDIRRSKRRRGGGRAEPAFESEHALVPGDTSFLPGLGRALRRMPNRTAVNALARFGAHQGKNAPAWRRSASRYGWARNRIGPLPIVDVEK